MSHVADVNLKVRDLAAWASAIKALGGTYDATATTIDWYGVFLDDWSDDRAARNRIDPKRFGKTDAGVARFPGCNYSVGLLDNGDGSYTPYYDSYAGGGGLTKVLGGMDCPRLKAEYAVAYASRIAARKGFRVARLKRPDGKIELKATI